MDMIATQNLDLAIAGDVITAVTGALIGAEVELFQNDIVPMRDIPIGDYTLANYDGYAAGAVTWLSPSLADDGGIEIVGQVPEFRPTGSVTPNTVYGFLLTNGAGTLLYAARFDNPPLSMGSALDSLIVTVRAKIPAGGNAVVVS